MAVLQRTHQPHLTFAAVYAIGLGLVRIAQRRKPFAHVLDDTVAHRQPQAGANTDRFGGEERFSAKITTTFFT